MALFEETPVAPGAVNTGNPGSTGLAPANSADTRIATSAGLSRLNNQQVANAFTIPGADAIGANIANIANSPAAANQMQASPLAGLTTLGQVANAGTQNAGVQQAGVTTAGLHEAGLAQSGLQTAGLSQAGLANAGHTAIDTGAQNQLLGGQVANINQLNDQAHGIGPSVAALQAKQQGDQNVAQQMAMLGSQRGASNSSLGMRQAMHAKAVADQQAVQAGVQGRAAEALSAQQQLTGALGGTQGQVMQGAQAQAGLTQGVNLANQSAANQQMLQNAQFGNAQQLQNAQMGNQVGLANTGAANAQMLQNAAFGNTQQLQNAASSNQVGLANMQAGNQVGLANAGASNTAQLQNAAGQNQAMLQQGQMTQQVQLQNAQQQAQQMLANLQAKQQTQGLNAQEQNAMLQAQMTLANNVSTANQNYMGAMINQHLQQQGINAGLSINAANNAMGMQGAAIAGGAALGAAGVTAMPDLLKSDERDKINISSGDRSVKNFLSQVAAAPISSNFNLWSK
jgi:hypothetical protein